MKKEVKIRAIEMRRDLGMSYREIISKLAEEGIKVSTGSLNNWLSGIELTDHQRAQIHRKMASSKAHEETV